MDALNALRNVLTEENPDLVLSLDDLTRYCQVVSSALGVHIEREYVRQGLWKEYNASDQAQQIKIKADRVMHTLNLIKEGRVTGADLVQPTVEELYDIINYAVFTVRKLKGTD